MTLIRLVAMGQPVSAKNHMRVVKFGNAPDAKLGVRTGKAIEKWYGAVVPELARQFAATGLRRIGKPVDITCHVFVKHDIDSPANPDGDGVQSAVWDALQKALVIEDDRRALLWHGSKQQDAARPRVEIELRILGAP